MIEEVDNNDIYENLYLDGGRTLNLAFRTTDSIPEYLIKNSSAQSVELVDLTETGIKDLQTLKIFPQLQTLILDKNFLTGVDLCPPLPCLHTLWLNNNAICDLPGTMDAIGLRFPRLRYLSMMRNPACPGLMDIVEPDLESCRLYRLYVLYRLPQLLFLDGIDVAEEERKEAKLRGQYAVKRRTNANVISPNSGSEGSGKDGTASASSSSRRNEAAPFVCKDGNVPGFSFSSSSALGGASDGGIDPDSLPLHPAPPKFKGKIAVTKTTKRFDSKHSEGNRFIVNSQL